MSKKLKPCPFCGNKTPMFGSYRVRSHDEYIVYTISCTVCDCVLSERSENEIIKRWNTRRKFYIRVVRWVQETLWGYSSY